MSRASRNRPVRNLGPQPTAAAPVVPVQNGSIVSGRETEVTPAMAEAWLKKNHPENRNVSWLQVGAFAQDMAAGKWDLTHQGICFDGDGTLIDGQHRLWAVVQSKATIRMMVFTNVAGTIRQSIDRTRARSVSLLTGYPVRVVAALSVLRGLETGYHVSTPLTPSEAATMYEAHSAFIDQLEALPKRGMLRGATLAACVYTMPLNPAQVQEFANKVATGEMIGRGHAAFAFRGWAERNKDERPWPVAMAAFNCLRHFLTGTSLSNVYTGESGYRGVVAKRRKLGLAHTPATDMVAPGVAWSAERDDQGAA